MFTLIWQELHRVKHKNQNRSYTSLIPRQASFSTHEAANKALASLPAETYPEIKESP